MRMTREAYAREVWKVLEAMREGKRQVTCPRENCNELLQVIMTSVKTGKALVCPQHGVIFRE
jgi:flavorubredoxin